MRVSSVFDKCIIVRILLTVNIIFLFLRTFIVINKQGVDFLRTIDKILILLKEQKKTQKDLTDFLDISKGVFTDWKSGKNSSYKKHIDKIAEFFGVSTDYLLGRTNVWEEENEPFDSRSASSLPLVALYGGDADVAKRCGCEGRSGSSGTRTSEHNGDLHTHRQ